VSYGDLRAPARDAEKNMTALRVPPGTPVTVVAGALALPDPRTHTAGTAGPATPVPRPESRYSRIAATLGLGRAA
jgi:hypothetical protein